MKTILASLLIPLTGCAVAVGPDHGGDEAADGIGEVDGHRTLRIEPAVVRANIIDHALVVQPLRAFMVDSDGAEIEVTDRTTFSVADQRFGGFAGADLYLRGNGAGETSVIAKVDSVSASIPLEVHTRVTTIASGVDAQAMYQFPNAITETGCGTKLIYPTAESVMPANLGALDVHWASPGADLFEIRISNPWAESITYTRADKLTLADMDWQVFATSRGRADIRVSAIIRTEPLTKCVDQKRTVKITDGDVAGAVYFDSAGSLVRHDLATGAVAAAPVFTGSDRPAAACIGCHALSRDGAHMAMTLDGASGAGEVFDFSEGRAKPILSNTSREPQHWSSATFTPDGDKLLAIDEGTMKLFDVASGAQLRTFMTEFVVGQPEISPTGNQLVTVEAATGSDWNFERAEVVIRSFSNDLDTVGERRVLLPYEAGTQSYYPSWSPDGKWIAVTRSASGSSYASHDAQIIVISADGARGPFAITAARDGGSWAKWLPYESSVGGEPVYFLSFTSKRAFGTALPAGTEQLWIAPFFPGRASTIAAGSPLAVTAPAFRAPWQDMRSNNHNAQWATSVVTNPGTIY